MHSKVEREPFTLKWTGKVGDPEQTETVCKKMEAFLSPWFPLPRGTGTGTGTATGLYEAQGFKDAHVVQGHMLNADLGGRGEKTNYFPINDGCNKAHSGTVEEQVKEAVLWLHENDKEQRSRRVWYRVEAKNGADAWTAASYAMTPDTLGAVSLHCESYITEVDGTTKDETGDYKPWHRTDVIRGPARQKVVPKTDLSRPLYAKDRLAMLSVDPRFKKEDAGLGKTVPAPVMNPTSGEMELEVSEIDTDGSHTLIKRKATDATMNLMEPEEREENLGVDPATKVPRIRKRKVWATHIKKKERVTPDPTDRLQMKMVMTKVAKQHGWGVEAVIEKDFAPDMDAQKTIAVRLVKLL